MAKNKKRFLYLIIILVLFMPSVCFGRNIEEIPPFTKNDRILILVPHPDDEAIATAGVIQKALKSGTKLKIVLFTNGDNNEPAFIIYEKRLTFRRGEFIHMGEVRRKETIDAMNYLGVPKDDIVFLGYPDFGTMAILTKYWGQTRPFKGFFTRSTKVPYPECLSPGAPYVGESILKDIKKVIADFRPTKIFVSHPMDTSSDHRSLYLFLQVALWDLGKAINKPEILPYLIHYPGWPRPRGYHPAKPLDPPEVLTEINWKKLPLPPDETARKYNCISFYKSEIEYDPPYLSTYARQNELFGDCPVVGLENKMSCQIASQNAATTLAYARDNGDLLIRINLKRKIDRDFGISVFLLGYNKNMNFALMPKIHIIIDFFGMHIMNEKKSISIKGANINYEGRAITVRIPLSGIGDPDYVLSSGRVAGLPFSQTVWRIIKLR